MMLNVNCLRAWVFFLLFRFDPDQEIESLEKKEEEEKKKKQEKARIMNMNAVPANLDLKGKCALSTSQSETELMRILDQELSVCLSVFLSIGQSVCPSGLLLIYHLVSVPHIDYQLFILALAGLQNSIFTKRLSIHVVPISSS